MGQEILGSSHVIPQMVVLDCAPELVGDALSVHLAQQSTSAAVWTLNVWVQVAQGWFWLGVKASTPPASGDDPSRTVIIATCPGAMGWRVDAYCPTDDEVADLTLQSSKCCSSVPGVFKLNDIAGSATDVYVLDRPWSNQFSTALTNAFVVKAASGNLRSVTLRVDSTLASGTYYVQVWALAAPPADTTAVTLVNSLAAPVKVVHVLGTDDLVRYDFDEYGVPFTLGASIGLSSTEFTKTLVAGAFMSIISAEYR
jgi:hypothetical protein